MIEQRQFASPKAAHAAFNELYGIAKEKTRHGEHFELRLVSVNRYYRHQLRKAFHGPVLRDISEQVWMPRGDGGRVRWSKRAWKIFFKDHFLGADIAEVIDPQTGEAWLRALIAHSESLNDDQFAEFLLQVCAFATLELGVVFRELEDE